MCGATRLQRRDKWAFPPIRSCLDLKINPAVRNALRLFSLVWWWLLWLLVAATQTHMHELTCINSPVRAQRHLCCMCQSYLDMTDTDWGYWLKITASYSHNLLPLLIPDMSITTRVWSGHRHILHREKRNHTFVKHFNEKQLWFWKICKKQEDRKHFSRNPKDNQEILRFGFFEKKKRSERRMIRNNGSFCFLDPGDQAEGEAEGVC